MAVSPRHLLEQGPVLRAMGRTALVALARRLEGGTEAAKVEVPGPLLTATVPPRPEALVRDAVRWAGGDPKAWAGRLPPWLFPQWGFPLVARGLEGLPYRLDRVVNAGARFEVRGPLPAGEALALGSRVTRIDDDGRRVLVHVHLETGPAEAPDRLLVDFQMLFPGAGPKPPGEKKGAARHRVPLSAREVARFRLGATAGLDFALLSGDFNPIHWLRPYARASGFKSTILHGFGTLARAYEGLVRNLYAGDVDAVRTVDVRFTRPLVLPAKVGLYVDGHAAPEAGLFVGDARGGPAYLAGTYAARASAASPSPSRSE